MIEATTVLSGETLIPLGVAIAILSPVALAFVWLQKKLNTMDRRLERIEESTPRRWTIADMRAWVLAYRILNPTIKVPAVISHDDVEPAKFKAEEP